MIKQWIKEYNQSGPHSTNNYRPPLSDTISIMATR
ncbi:hypothetical protein ACFLYM_01185 [Chloroflexota bacterium]